MCPFPVPRPSSLYDRWHHRPFVRKQATGSVKRRYSRCHLLFYCIVRDLGGNVQLVGGCLAGNPRYIRALSLLWHCISVKLHKLSIFFDFFAISAGVNSVKFEEKYFRFSSLHLLSPTFNLSKFQALVKIGFSGHAYNMTSGESPDRIVSLAR